MIKKAVLLFVLVLTACVTVLAQQTMTDIQVLEYVKTSMEQGKDQRQIATELARKGVTQEQAQRVKQLYEKNQENSLGDKSAIETDKSRQRTKTNNAAGTNTKNEEFVKNDFIFIDNLPDIGPLKERKFVTNEYGNILVDSLGKPLVVEKEIPIYGRDVFNTDNLTFEPSMNLATPPNYRLGPGDEVIIDIWGTNQSSIRETISPDGYISISDIGLVSLNGMTVNEATEYLRKELNRIYAGIDSESPSSEIKVTLGNSRTIQVNVMGEVFQPGTYALSSFATVFHALYRAGGVSNIGSLRDIQVVRAGKTIATVDVYDFIMNGKINDDIRLQEGDVIIVPPFESLVEVSGNVKRPMRYEMKNGEKLADLLGFSGGFSADAYTGTLRVIRQNGKEYQVYTVDDTEYPAFALKNGDVITAEPILNRFENKLEIKGAVYRPGMYQFGKNLNTVRQLINKADGLMGDAFTARAVLYRERPNLTREVIPLDIQGIMNGSKPDVTLMANDVIYVPSIHDLEDMGNVSVIGEVARPGALPYADNMTLEDVIIQAGGLKESASTVRVDVARRIRDTKSTSASPVVGEMYSFALKDGFVVDGDPGFILKPYDEVYVRRSPGYQEQMQIEATGEVLYDGIYSLTNKNERLSDLINKAGGVTPYAYVKGAKLMRKANAEELKRMEDVLKLMSREMGESNKDSLKLDLDSIFSVGIDLELALAAPGSDADVVLREGDKLIVPEMDNTVKINGAVMMPNTVAFSHNKPLNYYISQAGGYANGARASKAFIIYKNGQVAKLKGSGKKMIEPGCEIIIPVKDKTKTSAWNLQTILAIAGSLGSLGLTAASIANIIK